MRRTIVVADARRLVRDGLRSLLASTDGLRIVGEAENGRAAIEVILAERPDVAVVDAELTDPTGIEAVQELGRRGAMTRCVVTADGHSARLVRAALLAGAAGFVPKTSPARDLLDAIGAAVSRSSFFVRCLGTSVAAALRPSDAGDGASSARLSDRQRQVLKLIAEGMSTREIALELGVSVKTADTHRTKLMEKLDLHKTSALVRYAIREGIVRA